MCVCWRASLHLTATPVWNCDRGSAFQMARASGPSKIAFVGRKKNPLAGRWKESVAASAKPKPSSSSRHATSRGSASEPPAASAAFFTVTYAGPAASTATHTLQRDLCCDVRCPQLIFKSSWNKLLIYMCVPQVCLCEWRGRILR